MRRLVATILVTLAVLLGNSGGVWCANFQKGAPILINEETMQLPNEYRYYLWNSGMPVPVSV